MLLPDSLLKNRGCFERKNAQIQCAEKEKLFSNKHCSDAFCTMMKTNLKFLMKLR